MSKKDEALKLARDALEHISSHYMSLPKIGCMALAAVDEALADQPAQQWNAGVPSLYPEPEQSVSIKVEYEQPEFFTHNVEHPYDWSEWVCPDPKSYLMKCCDCGLVHEAEFGVVRYKSENEREDCDMVDDPNLQAVTVGQLRSAAPGRVLFALEVYRESQARVIPSGTAVGLTTGMLQLAKADKTVALVQSGTSSGPKPSLMTARQ